MQWMVILPMALVYIHRINNSSLLHIEALPLFEDGRLFQHRCIDSDSFHYSGISQNINKIRIW